jgi:hypothetical protein
MKSVLTLLCAAFAAVASAQTDVEIHSTPGYPGQTASVAFSVRRATNLVAAQFDVAYNPAKGTMREPELSARFSNHVVRSREVAPGTRRVLVYSRANEPLRTNGFTGAFAFDVPPDERIGSGPLTPRNLVLARADATAIAPVGARSGAVFVTPVYRDPASGVVDLFFPSALDTRYLIQATEDFTRWVTIATNVATGDFMDLVDTDAVNYPHRFYRTALYDAAGELGAITRQPDGGVRFSLSGLSGRAYVLQASTNLRDWTHLRTNVAAGGGIEFTIPAEPGVPQRFFRVQSR